MKPLSEMLLGSILAGRVPTKDNELKVKSNLSGSRMGT